MILSELSVLVNHSVTRSIARPVCETELLVISTMPPHCKTCNLEH